MSRIHRLRTTDRIFFVTVKLCRPLPAFGAPEYPMMIDVLESSRARLRFLLYGHVLLLDHWHALVWQHQFWDRFVRHEKEFAARLDYIHLNPVRKCLADRPEQWRWSSCNNFTLDKEEVKLCPIQIDYVRLPQGYRG